MPGKTDLPDASQQLAQAGRLLAQGHPDAAVAWCESVLSAQADNADALHLLGVAALQQGQAQRAIGLMDRALALQPERADFYANRGLAWQALADMARALHDLDRAVALDPASATAHFNQGVARHQQRAYDLAWASYEAALALAPTSVPTLINSGAVLQALGQWPAAVQRYDQALALAPDHPDAHSNRGVALGVLGQYDAALASAQRAVVLQPTSAQHHYNLGNALRDLHQYEDAVAAYDRALALQAGYVQAHSNRGVALQKLGRLGHAIVSYDRAIALDGQAAHAHYNRGTVLHELQQLNAAIGSYDRALQAQPDYPEAHWNKALALLLGGDLAQGLPLYEWRWHARNQGPSAPVFTEPLWLGTKALAGKTLLLHAEQGLGDTLMFCRYAELLRSWGARVLLEVPQPLNRLLQGLDGVDQLLVQGQARGNFDLHCPLMSLPLAVQTYRNNAPKGQAAPLDTLLPNAQGAYLAADGGLRAQWQATLENATTQALERLPRVGIVWRGSSTHANDHNRSLPLAELLAHLPQSCQYVALQKVPTAGDAATLQANLHILQMGHGLSDFADTAALLACLDHVVCVDTAVAHLAGAMGLATSLLLPFTPDWRWQLGRSDSPWYPTLRLYRQQQRLQWGAPLQALARDLGATRPGLKAPR
ncbi:MAG: tetratricopeptide repeat protein [Betaproteobacteria bacterium]